MRIQLKLLLFTACSENTDSFTVDYMQNVQSKALDHLKSSNF